MTHSLSKNADVTRYATPLRALLATLAILASSAAAAPSLAEGAPSPALIEWMLDVGDYRAALDAANARLVESPDDPRWLLIRAVASFRLGSLDDAELAYRHVLSREPDEERARRGLAAVLLARASRIEPDDEVSAPRRRQLYGEAADLLAREDPATVHPRLLADRALALEGAGRPTEAIEMLERIVERGGTADRELLYRIDELLQRTGQWDRALVSIQRVAEPDAETAVRVFNIGVALYRDERYGDAVAALQRAIDVDPANGHFHRVLGLSLMKLERREEAIESLRTFIELLPDHPEAKRLEAQLAGSAG